MFIVIINIMMILSQKLLLGGCGIPSITNVNQNCYLKRMPMHFLDFIVVLK